MGVKEAMRELYRTSSQVFKTKKNKKDLMPDFSNPGYKLIRSVYRARGVDGKSFAFGNFARVIIDTAVSFLGTPHFKYEADKDEALDFLNKNPSVYIQNHKTHMSEILCYLRFIFVEGNMYDKSPRFETKILTQDKVDKLTDMRGNVIGFRVTTTIQFDRMDPNKSYKQVEEVYEDRTILTRMDGDFGTLPATETIPNKFGVMPIIEFVNEPDGDGVGISDLAIPLPFMGMYADILIQARRITHLHSNPMFKIKSADFEKLKTANTALFDENDAVDMEALEVLFLGQDDDAGYVKLEASIEALTTLLEYIFYCIAQTGRTPEFLFGTGIASSKASVTEQMAVMDVKIDDKRQALTVPYLQMAKVFQTMWGKVNPSYTPSVITEITWNSIDLKNPDIANIAKIVMEAVDKAMGRGIMDEAQAKELVAKYFK